MTTHQKHNFFALMAFAAILAVDQLIKYRSILEFNYFLNNGLIFGFLKSNVAGIIISVILLLFITWLIFYKKIALFPLTVLFAGISSNLIDRFFYKGVIDYWSFFGLFWFNLADTLIVLVVVLALVTYFYTKKQP